MAQGLSLNIPQETMSQLIGHAILQAIDEEARTALLQSAINFLVAPSMMPTNRYGQSEPGPSPLESAFRDALHVYSRDYVKTWMASNAEFQAAMDGKLGELFAGIHQQLRDDGNFARDLSEWLVTYVLDKQRERHGDGY